MTDAHDTSSDAMPLRPGSRAHRRAKGALDPHMGATTRAAITVERIVTEAIKVLDADGLDAVSMRRVAAEIGTGPASLYAHVGDKHELLELMLDRVLEAIEVPEPDPECWQEQLKIVARRMREAYRPHSDIAVVSLGNVPTIPSVLRITEGLLAIMVAGGVPPRMAGWFIDRLAQYVDADSFEGAILHRKFGEDAAAGEQWFEDMQAYFSNLPPERFPHITRMLGDLMGGGDDERFEFGLSLLVDGLADQVRRIAD